MAVLAGGSVLAFQAARLAARSGLHLNADGFRLRPRPLGTGQHYQWASFRAIEPVAGTGLLLHPRRGGPPERLELAKFHQAEALRERILAHAAHQGLAVAAGGREMVE